MPFLFCLFNRDHRLCHHQISKSSHTFPLRVKKTTNVSVDTAEPVCMHAVMHAHSDMHKHTHTHTHTHTHILSLSQFKKKFCIKHSAEGTPCYHDELKWSLWSNIQERYYIILWMSFLSRLVHLQHSNVSNLFFCVIRSIVLAPLQMGLWLKLNKSSVFCILSLSLSLTHTHTCTHRHTDTHTLIHTHAHTHTCTQT